MNQEKTETLLRFTGDWPVLPVLGVAALLALVMFFYYRRELRFHQGPARWVPALLRALAVFILALTLSGPVLRHVTTLRQLGRVVLAVDASASMSYTDLRDLKSQNPKSKIRLALHPRGKGAARSGEPARAQAGRPARCGAVPAPRHEGRTRLVAARRRRGHLGRSSLALSRQAGREHHEPRRTAARCARPRRRGLGAGRCSPTASTTPEVRRRNLPPVCARRACPSSPSATAARHRRPISR